jgi:Secretion system C-terminal sorting domain
MKNLLSILILFCFVFPVHSYAQLNTDWMKTFGGINEDEGYSVHQTTDGGFIISGSTASFGTGNSDFWLIKTDSNGEITWTKTFGGPSVEYGGTVQQTTDGGYIITGSTYSFGAGNSDVWLIKTDSNGDTLWIKTFGGTAADGGTYVQQTVDGGFVIIGTTNSFGAGNTDYLLMKTDSNGDSLWSKTFGGVYNDVAFSGQQTSDNGFIIAGYTQPLGFENADIWLIKTDSNGDTLWTKTFGSEFNELAYSVQQTSDDGYIITGYIYPGGSIYLDVLLIRTDSNGDTLWTKTFGGSSSEAGQSVIETSDNGFIVCGFTFSFSPLGDEDIWLIKTDSDGNTAWTNTLIGSDSEIGFSIDQTTDDGFIITGSIQQSGNNGKDLLLLRVDSDGQITNVENSGSQPVSSFKLNQNYPNPFNPSTIINYSLPSSELVQIKVYDALGTEIKTLVNEFKQAGIYTIEFNAGNLPSGIYFYRMQAGSFSDTKKLILMK